MKTYGIAIGVGIALFFTACFLQIVMQNQVKRAKYGNQEIGPRDPRAVTNLLGLHGSWKSHKELYERSAVRSIFLVVSAGLITCIAFLVYSWTHVRF